MWRSQPKSIDRMIHAKLRLLQLLSALLALNVSALTQFQLGAVWLDTDVNPIQAHGGGMLVRSNILRPLQNSIRVV
ncbi:MAG: hypothetical protein EPO07_11295 [Verrucomicrobia bacterium]|nr:MAG: hypothetical protein EPO07_11295 [Verrucomicrobiota bacterium]